MKSPIMVRLVCFLSVPILLAIGLSRCRPALGDETPEPDVSGLPMLSVRESLIPVFGMRHAFVEGEPNVYVRSSFPHGRLNPEIAKYLRGCLQEQAGLAAPSHTQLSALCCLGFVCTPEDINWVDSYVSTFLTGFCGRGGDPLYGLRFAEVVGKFGGMAIMRHPGAAGPFVEKYSQISSWAPYGKAAKTSGGGSWEQTACGYFVLNAYANSKSGDLLAVLRKQPGNPEESLGVPAKTVDGVARAPLASYVYLTHPRVSVEEQERVVAECMESFGKQIDALMQRVDNPADAPAPPMVDSVRQADERASVRFVPASGPMVGYAQATVEEALASYSALATAWTTRDMAKLRGRLLDNGVPLRDREFDAFLMDDGEMERERKILLAIAEIGPAAFRDFDLKLSAELSWKAESITDPGRGLPAKALAKEEAILTFTVRESRPILRKYWSPPMAHPDERSQAPDGNLRVYMRRIDGRWYWNPFGW